MNALLLRLWRSVVLYVGIVGRDFHGVRISPWAALQVVRIVYPKDSA